MRITLAEVAKVARQREPHRIPDGRLRTSPRPSLNTLKVRAGRGVGGGATGGSVSSAYRHNASYFGEVS